MPSHRSFPRLFPLLCLLILVTLVLPCPAAELEKEDTMIPLHVAAGTNLIHLARDYCRDRNDWHEIARINRLTEPYLIIHDTSLQVPLSKMRRVPFCAGRSAGGGSPGSGLSNTPVAMARSVTISTGSPGLA